MSIAKEILLDELIEQSHPSLVETVIHEALSDYYKKGGGTFNSAIAYSICMRIDEAEVKGSSDPIMNPELVKSLIQ